MMKFKIFLMVILLIGLSNSHKQENQHYSTVNTLLKNIADFQSKIQQILSSMEEPTSAIFVVGDSGSGKSTFINFMVGSPLKMMKMKRMNGYILANNEAAPSLPIGHQKKSKTKIPTAYKDKQGRVWIDTPGFEDTQGSQVDILNFLLTNQLLNRIQRKKIVLLISQDRLVNDRSQSVKQNLLKLKNWLGESFGTLTIVVSKAQDICPYRQYIQEIINDDDSSNALENRRYLLKILKNSQIMPFYLPTHRSLNVKDGLEYVNQVMRQEMVENLQKIQYFKTKKAKNIFVGDNAYVIYELKVMIEEEINNKFEQLQREIKKVAKSLAIQKFQMLISLFEDYIKKEGQKARQWRKKSYKATSAEIQEEIAKISNLQVNEQFIMLVDTLSKIIKDKEQDKRSIKILAIFEEIINLSQKFTKVFQNTFLSTRDGGNYQILVLEINLQVQKFVNNLSSSLLFELGQRIKSEEMKKRASNMNKIFRQKVQQKQKQRKKNFWSKAIKLFRESYDLIYEEVVNQVLPTAKEKAQAIGSFIAQQVQNIMNSQFVQKTEQMIRMHAYMLKVSRLGRWVSSFFSDQSQL